MFETLGHYRILDRIGAGGMGEVYRARDTRLGRTVAIKVIAADIAGDPGRRERFVLEARASLALSHPNIATLYEVGEDQDQLFCVFEYVPGETLKKVIAGRPLNPRRAIDLSVQVADALADAHAEGIVHRDITADNVVVTPKGNAKVIDFGLAAWTASGAARDRAGRPATADPAGAANSGPLPYLSPEQARGEPTDYRTDIFSLGVVMFEMLTGRLPFAAATAAALAQQIAETPAPPPSAVNRSLPAELDPIVGKAMAKVLGQRYESAATLAAELRSVGAILDVRSDTQEAAAAFVAAPRGRSAGGWVLLLIVLLAVLVAAWYERAALERLWQRTFGSSPAPVLAVIPLDAEPRRPLTCGFADDLTVRLG
ncbi:MAG: serine/threonine-protein kinase [Vicinamibacterales bacterium]